MQTVYHVVPNGGEWAVKRQGAERASRLTSTQAEAVSEAETLAQNQAPSRVVVHGEDGRVTTQHTFDRTAGGGSAGSDKTSYGLWAGAAAALIGFAGASWFLARRDAPATLDDVRRELRALKKRSPF